MLSAALLNVIILSVAMASVEVLGVIILSAVMPIVVLCSVLIVAILSVSLCLKPSRCVSLSCVRIVMLSVVVQNAIRLVVVAPKS